MHYPVYSLHYKTIDWINILYLPVYKQLIVKILNQLVDSRCVVIHGWCLTCNQLKMLAGFPLTYDLKKFETQFFHRSAVEVVQLMEEVKDSRKDWILPHLESASEKLKCIDPYKLWQDGSSKCAIAPQDTPAMYECLNEIHNIPVVMGLVKNPVHYLYSSAPTYAGGEAYVNIRMIHFDDRIDLSPLYY